MPKPAKPPDRQLSDPCDGWPLFCYEACPPPPEVDLQDLIEKLSEDKKLYQGILGFAQTPPL